VVDTRDDKIVKVIRVGADPWRAYMSHDGRYAVTVNNGDETVSFIDTRTNSVVATWPAGSGMTGVNFAAGKAFVISPDGFLYVYDMKSLKPAGRIKVGTNIQIETATTDTAEQKLYLANSTANTVVVVDARTEKLEQIANVGLYPWGTHVMDSKDNYCH
jgi:YVTN family beta-propeller protein